MKPTKLLMAGFACALFSMCLLSSCTEQSLDDDNIKQDGAETHIEKPKYTPPIDG